MDRFRDYYRRWRNRVEAPPAGEEDRSNFQVPMIQWQTFGAWGQMMQMLLGDDAEIIAQPTGPADQKIVGKVGRYATARYIRQMDNAISRYALFTFRAILFGRSIAYRPWVRDTFEVEGQEQVWYEGPGFFPLWPDDVIVPAEDVESIHDFSFVVRKYRVTPQELLDGEEDKRYFGIEKNFQEFVDAARDAREREVEGDELKDEKDLSEGVTYDGSQAKRGSLLCIEWHGRWRMPKGTDGLSEENLARRHKHQTDLVVRVIPDMAWRVVGIDSLAELYPKMKRRRPFADLALVKDGSYWPMGLGEMLCSIEDESSHNHNIFTEAGEFAIGPVIFYRPGSGFNPNTFRYQSRQTIPSEDPAGVNAVQTRVDLSYAIAKQQALDSMGERVTGRSDASLGRVSDRPNQPRTLGQQMLLTENANVRISLDAMFLREDFQRLIEDFWMLEQSFPRPEVFFRITEAEAGGLFETSLGGAVMTGEEFGGRFDFRIKFATSVWSKEATAQKQFQLYGLDIQNPLIVQNPRALWLITNQVHKALGDDNFGDLIPEPPDLGQPKNPRDEWTLMLQGEHLQPNAMDNDDVHLLDHYRRLAEHGRSGRPDQDAMSRMAQHIIETEEQKRQKMMMQALAQQLAEDVAGAARGQLGGGGVNLGGLMGGLPGGGEEPEAQ